MCHPAYVLAYAIILSMSDLVNVLRWLAFSFAANLPTLALFPGRMYN